MRLLQALNHGIFQENKNLITFGNGVWTKKTFFDQLENDFLETLDTDYLADFNFFNQNPVTQINEWVNRTTRGKIDKLLGKYNHFLAGNNDRTFYA